MDKDKLQTALNKYADRKYATESGFCYPKLDGKSARKISVAITTRIFCRTWLSCLAEAD